METFVVRVWRPAHGVSPEAPADDSADADADDAASTASPEGELKGTILHPASGQERPFTNDAELLEILRELRAAP